MKRLSYVIVSAGIALILIACSREPQVITADNASQVVELYRLGLGAVNELDISPDDSMLAVASTTGVQVYDMETYEMLFRSPDSWANSIDWSPDSRYLVSGHSDGTVTVWDAESWDALRSQRSEECINSVAWSPDGTKIATSSIDNGPITIWDADTLDILETFPFYYTTSVVWSSNNQTLALHSGVPRRINFFDVNSGELIPDDELEQFIGDDAFINGLNTGAFIGMVNKDGYTEISADGGTKALFRIDQQFMLFIEGGNVIRYNFESGEREILMELDWRKISWNMDWNSTSDVLIISEELGDLLVVDLNTKEERVPISGYFSGLSDIVWEPNSSKLAYSTVKREQNIFIWDFPNDLVNAGYSMVDVKIIGETIYNDARRISTMAWVSESEFLAAGRIPTLADNTIIGWDVLDQNSVFEVSDTSIDVDCVPLYSPNGDYIAFLDSGRTSSIVVIELETMQNIFNQTLWGYSSVTRWAPDNLHIVRYNKTNHRIDIWNVIDGIRTQSWRIDSLFETEDSNSQLHILEFSYEQDFLVGRNHLGNMWIWDAETGEELLMIDSEDSYYSAAGWSPMSNLLAFNTSEGLVIWDPVTQEQIALLGGFDGGIKQIVWSPDGTQIATIGQDQAIRVWGIP